MEISDEEINEEKVRNEDILTEEEILNIVDMKLYRERIENIIGRQYSYIFFDYLENIYLSKTKNKMSEPLTEFLKKGNNGHDTIWMKIYKSIIFYSKQKIPIIIVKYFRLKAENEFKFLYNESKKYTNNPFKFIDVYIKKMKRINYKKLKELCINSNEDIFNIKSRKFFLKSLITKKSLLFRPKLKLFKNKFTLNNEEEHSDSSTKEDEIKYKRQMRTKIMKQVRQLKIDSIKEVERANILQNKQKKKYGDIKSRFLDVFENEQKFLKNMNYKSTQKPNNRMHNNINFNKNKEEYELIPLFKSKKSINNSKLSALLSKEDNYSKKNSLNYSKYYSELLDNNIFNSKNQTMNSSIKNIKNLIDYKNGNKLDLITNMKKKSLKNIKHLFDVEANNKFRDRYNNRYNAFNISNRHTKNVNRFLNTENIKFEKSKLLNSNKNLKKRPKSSYYDKNENTKNLINKLEMKKNKEFFDNIINRNSEFDCYNNQILQLFKKTECF